MERYVASCVRRVAFCFSAACCSLSWESCFSATAYCWKDALPSPVAAHRVNTPSYQYHSTPLHSWSSQWLLESSTISAVCRLPCASMPDWAVGWATCSTRSYHVWLAGLHSEWRWWCSSDGYGWACEWYLKFEMHRSFLSLYAGSPSPLASYEPGPVLLVCPDLNSNQSCCRTWSCDAWFLWKPEAITSRVFAQSRSLPIACEDVNGEK